MEDEFTWLEYCVLLLAVYGLYQLIQNIALITRLI